MARPISADVTGTVGPLGPWPTSSSGTARLVLRWHGSNSTFGSSRHDGRGAESGGAVGDCKCGAGLNKMSHSDILSDAPVGHPAHTCVGQATYSTDSRVGEREPHEARGKGDGPR